MNKSGIRAIIGVLVALIVTAGVASAQYQPIPNFTGVGAGYNFRQAINQRFSGAEPISPTIVDLSFANLPTEQDGMLLWCKDCQETTPCSGGGAGAFARGERGVWSCAADTLEQDLNANGHQIAAASSVLVENSGDINPREQLKAGTGVRVSNGSGAPFTVIDENANITGHINGVLNVKAPPYNAKGDCTTDDTAAIQGAINAACAANPSNQQNIPPVYLPPTPYPGCYKITSPILVDCANLKIYGAGEMQTIISPQFYGPDLIVQSTPSSSAPLTSSVTAAWQASHAYPQYAEIRDSNGNIEVATTAGTSGGAAPTWPTAQGATVSDGGVTWTLEVIGSQLASGSGSAYDTESTSVPALDLGWAGSPMNLNGLSQFSVELYVDVVHDSGPDTFSNIVGSYLAQPALNLGTGPSAGAFAMWLSGSNGNTLQAEMDIGGTQYTLTSPNAFTFNTTHHLALSYDGSTIRLFDNGTMVASQAASGTVTQRPFENVFFPGFQPATWTSSYGSVLHTYVQGYFDSLRISNIARYTTNFTAPTAKFAQDSNTLMLINFPTNAPAGTVEGSTSAFGRNAFFPIEVGSFMTNIVLKSFEFCPGNSGGGGLWAVWAVDSRFENLHCSSQSEYAVELWDNDFQDTLRNIFAFGGDARTSYGFVFGNQSNGNEYDHLQCDGQDGGCIFQSGASGSYKLPIYTDRGSGIYPFVIEGRAVLKDPFTDIEVGNTGFLADVLAWNAWAPVIIQGGELDTPNSTDAHLAVNGGQPIVDIGSTFGGTASAEVVNVISNPVTPVTIRDATLPSGVPLTNPGKTAEVYANIGGNISGLTVSTGIKFSDLPSPVINGASFYCPDCDPPANPPIACTSSGAKTGAWVHGLNGAWICTP